MSSSSEQTTLPLLRRHLNVYLDGASGVPYETLVEFAEPLFELFEIDPRAASLRGAERQADELATMLSTLDLARLFWAYFLLEAEDVNRARDQLRNVLLDAPPSPDDLIALDELLEILADRWFALAKNAVDAGSSGYALPPFGELLEAYAQQQGTPSSYAPSAADTSTDRPDALATFARPLFEAANPDDPASIDDALARAQAYWDLAQTPESEYRQKLARIARRFSNPDRSPDVVRSEADAMRRRFHQLFRR